MMSASVAATEGLETADAIVSLMVMTLVTKASRDLPNQLAFVPAHLPWLFRTTPPLASSPKYHGHSSAELIWRNEPRPASAKLKQSFCLDADDMDWRVASGETGHIREPFTQPHRYVRLAVILLALALAFTVGGWWLLRAPAVAVSPVTRGSAAEIVYATGAVEPETWSRTTPLVRGRIIERCRCESSFVQKGQLLARLDDKEALAALSELKAQEEFQLREFDRQTQLLARGAASSQAYQRAESDLARVRAQVAAQVQRLEYYKVTAPISGTVLREDGEIGDVVEPGTVLFRVGLARPLWVVSDVNEEDIPRVQVGQKALLRTDAFAGSILTGVVKQITPAGNPVTKTFRVRIGLPDDTPLQVGMSVEANIVSQEKSGVLLVPTNALVNSGLLVIEKNRAVSRKVIIGIRGQGFTEITTGVSEGDLVVSPATTNIKEGSRVRPQETGPTQ